MNLLKNVKLTVILAAVAAGTSTQTSDVLDQSGFDGVMYIALLGDVTATSVLTLTAKENTANSINSPTPTSPTGGSCTYTAGATDADSKVMVVDIFRPQKRYQFCTLSRTTANAVIGGIIAIQYKANSRPTTQDATVIAQAVIAGNAGS